MMADMKDSDPGAAEDAEGGLEPDPESDEEAPPPLE